MRRRIALAALVLMMSWPSWAAMRTEHLVIQTRSGPVEVTVEMALTAEEQSRGLMYRTGLAERHGMLFDFQKDGPAVFWMKNTLIPLDMVFIDAALTVRHVNAMAEPLSERNVVSPYPVRYVLEIAGGEAARLGIAPGDKVERRP